MYCPNYELLHELHKVCSLFVTFQVPNHVGCLGNLIGFFVVNNENHASTSTLVSVPPPCP